jgi:hypothetical protein
MELLSCVKCGQKPTLETHPVHGNDAPELHRLSCQCGAGTWHPIGDDIVPLVNEWNVANTPPSAPFQMEMAPEPEKLPEYQDAVIIINEAWQKL